MFSTSATSTRSVAGFFGFLTTFLMLFLALFFTAGSNASQASEAAWQAVRSSTDLLLEKLVEVQPIYERNPERFFTEVEIALAPHIDFTGFARGVMAKHYRLASSEERSRFKQVFKKTLVRTYARALAEFDNEEVVVLPPTPGRKSDKPQNPNKAIVRLEIRSKSGNVYPVTYQMARSGGKWLLRNLIVDGVNIGKQFQSQFNSYMSQYKTVDAVIENWAVES